MKGRITFSSSTTTDWQPLQIFWWWPKKILKKSLKYTATGGEERTGFLQRANILNLIYLQKRINEEPNRDLWTDFTYDIFQQWIRDDRSTNPSTTTLPAPTSSSTRSTSTVSKRDLGIFKEIHKRFHWQTWIKGVKIRLIQQGVFNVLDESYDASTKTPEIDNAYLYCDFDSCIEYTSGRLIVTQGADTHDGRATYTKLDGRAKSTIVLTDLTRR